jgi:hypothetical protein
MTITLGKPAGALSDGDKMVSIYDYANDDTGVSDEAVNIQNAINAATSGGKGLDLGEGIWRFNSQLTLTCPIKNGELVASIPDQSNKEDNCCIVAEPAMGDTYAYTEIRNVRIRRLQYANKVALRIDRGLRILLRDVHFDNWRNGSCQPLWIRSTQVGEFNRVIVDGYGVAAAEISGMTGYSASTDCHFVDCSFIDGLDVGSATIQFPTFDSQYGAAAIKFSRCEFFNSYGAFLEADSARRTNFTACRFETWRDGYNAVSLTNTLQDANCKYHRIDGCSFGPGDGVTSIINVGSDVDSTILLYNLWGSASPVLTNSGTNTTLVDP